MNGSIEVDPDVLAEIRDEYGPLPDVSEQYNKAIRGCLSFDFDMEVPRGDAE